MQPHFLEFNRTQTFSVEKRANYHYTNSSGVYWYSQYRLHTQSNTKLVEVWQHSNMAFENKVSSSCKSMHINIS